MMDAAQAFRLDMSIDFRGADVRVPEQELYRAQIRAAFQQMRGKGMPESMGRDGSTDTRQQGVFLLTAQGPAGTVDEKLIAAGRKQRTPGAQIIAQQILNHVMQGH